MRQEINVALDLLTSYVQRFGSINEGTLERFRAHLLQSLLQHYQGHWYPDKPTKGQAYRSLEFNKDKDYCNDIVAQICQKLGFASKLLGIRHELTLWIDPFEITIRLGNHASPKENQQLVVARFDTQGNELIRNDLDTLLSQSNVSATTNTIAQTFIQATRLSPTNSTSYDSANCSGTSTPQRTSSPLSMGQSMIVNSVPSSSNNMLTSGNLYTTPRALSPQAPEFQMLPSSPIKVPRRNEQNYSLQYMSESISCEGSPSDGNHLQPDRSDTPHSMHSTTSNESSDSGYCGYVESFPYYYKLNRLQKALAIQKLSMNGSPIAKGFHTPHHSHQYRRNNGTGTATAVRHQYPQQVNNYGQNPAHLIPNSSSTLSNSPPTPTPININQLAPFCLQTSSYFPMPATVSESRKFKY